MLDAVANNHATQTRPANEARLLRPAQLHKLEQLGRKVTRFGLNFAVVDAAGQVVMLLEGGGWKSNAEQLGLWARRAIEANAVSVSPDGDVSVFDEDRSALAAVLSLGRRAEAVVVVDLDKTPMQGNERQYLSALIAFFAESFESEYRTEHQIEQVSTELAQTYEELVLLYKLSTHMRVTESDANYLQMACDNLTDIVGVEGIVVLLDRMVAEQRRLVLAAGSGIIDIDDRLAAKLQNRLADEIARGKEALLDSEVDSPFKYEWPERIRNVIAVPLHGKERSDGQPNDSMMGMMVAVNRIDKPDFDSTDMKLFNSVAAGCAVFVENVRLFRDLRELFIGSLKALTNSIDAKDQYTRGHSERVAFISRWIAEEFAQHEPLEQDDIHRIYLAGLLHDIGKMGIDEAVLRKAGKLTEDEINHIRTHPPIGAGILREIKQMRHIVPGVLCHHERIDGKGYPNGLVGTEIPLIGKIIGLADSFDAMTSKRIYRAALTVEQALAEIEKGLGTQFDEKVGRVFLNSDVYRLWDALQNGSDFIGTSGISSFAEYGALAVGALVK
jgi:HD-GYP domain-containing protein (c-di-GMP phosphodiesterase class II)